jgi:hypothetical protein
VGKKDDLSPGLLYTIAGKNDMMKYKEEPAAEQLMPII